MTLLCPEEIFLHLFEIEEDMPGAVVYGGFLRDWLLGIPHRDIDIAVSAGRHDLHGLGYTPVNHDDHGPYNHTLIHQVWQREDYNVIEFACHVDARGMNDYVDIGLCKVAWSHAEGIVIDPKFLIDHVRQTLTVYRTGWGEEGVKAHVERLLPKFPGYVEYRE